jgi:hypothetical protein
MATKLSRLTDLHCQITEVAEIERLELRFKSWLPVSSVSRRGDYGHGQDVGIEVHILDLFVLLVSSGRHRTNTLEHRYSTVC